jgi:hypothetical protein
MRDTQRWRAVVGGFARGCVAGLLIAVPLWLWFSAPDSGPSPRYKRWDLGRGAMALPLAFLGGVVGFALGKIRTTLPARRSLLLRRGLLWAGGCFAAAGLLLGWLLLRVHLYGVRFDLGFLDFVGPVLFAATFLAVMGFYLIAEKGTQAGEAQEQEAVARRLADLHRRRDDLAHAVAERFGPLDEARRTLICSWDHERIAEARRKLPEASHPDDL